MLQMGAFQLPSHIIHNQVPRYQTGNCALLRLKTIQVPYNTVYRFLPLARHPLPRLRVNLNQGQQVCETVQNHKV